jgi:hypothetical protein
MGDNITDNQLLQLALWLETAGLFLSAVLIGAVKWPVLKPLNDTLKSFVKRLPNKLKTFFGPYVWLLSKLATEGGKIPNGIEQEHLPIYTLRLIIWVSIVAPILLVLLTALVIPIYLVMLIAKIFSGHNALTNAFIILGTCMALAGLVIELILSY